MATTTTPEPRIAAADRAPATPDGQATVARLWVAHGVLWLALIAYVWGAWIVSGDFTPNTIGRGLEPTWYVVAVWIVQIGLGVIFSAWILWHFVIGPKLRTGRLSFDGLFFLACWLVFFQEPWMNWINLQFLYATTFVNFGSWLNQIPGWSLPNARLIPVPMVYGMAYLWMLGFGAWAGSRYMARQRRRDPGRSNGRLIWQTFGAMVLVDLIGESIMIHLQLISYPRTIPSLTLWAGTDHQFPLYELLAWPGTFIIISSLHFFRDDQGRSWPERGIDRIGIRNGKLHTFARFAAIAGVCQLAILVAFNIPYQIYGLHAGPVPKALLDRPWRMAGICGPGTAFDCGPTARHRG
ncbi:MAG: spirocyclase AveC family protein [Solirubrobacteraceae bacterium]